MVQKKVINKLGIKADHIKANKQIMNHKPSLPISQSHDIKNRGAELKKKMMKKSGKTKHSEYEICHSPNFRKYVPQPGKPPPNTDSSTPKKHQHQQQQQQQQSTSTPNYMKSTSSSVARKEQSQVSSRSLQTYSQSCSRKNSNNSKLGSASSVNKPTRSLLARTPSFKPTRVSSCSPIVLYNNFQVERRATCSSTLKEVKFPSYLELSPGGTESDGTSVFKVCPYTYCSLNGHHHPPLPPLKCFLSARRRTLKNQKNFKLGCLSPRGLGLNDNVPKQIESTTEKVAPLTNEDEGEFFVEIYSRKNNSVDDHDTDDSSSADLVPLGESSEVAADDTEDNLDQKREAILAEINTPGFCPAENPNEGASDMVQGEVDYESLSMHTELEMEATTEELESEASDMDWDVEKYDAYSEDETGSISNDIDLITLVDDSVISEELTEKSSNPELLLDNNLEETFDKESIISGTSYDYDDSESLCSHTEFDIDECVEVSEDSSFISLGVNLIVDGTDSETATMDYQAAVKAEETFCLDDEISICHEECLTLQDDDATASTGYQELSEVQDETCKDNEKCSDENIVVKMEDAEIKTDCCEQGNENGHGNNAKQVVVEADLKDESDEDVTSHQAEDGSENTSGVEVDQTAEACVENEKQIKDKKTHAKYDLSDEVSERYINLRGIARRNDTKEPEESREFNPRPPNFLPLEPDPDAEKVDLKHQMMDDRKNAEDWMLDFALRRAVDKLAPARKRKVALLVEAFETVLPTSKWEPHLRRSASGFAHPRPIQACN
ncbi:calmodulin binding protein PICBP-like [Solanum dulcamara]|uniref:calmodulin binding protein PICBP-like n=1 Tax=Solanum dulcamara TaxID=45834 RepID=UPI002485F4A3|nr:calmodulin binding protein PICBP-like [Solanum dulcamara]